MVSDPKTRKVEKVVSTIQEEAEQIDSISVIRGWFRPDKGSASYQLVQDYLNGTKTLAEAITHLSEHIHHLESQRKKFNYFELALSILHSAKRIPWKNEEKHTQLVEFVRQLKSPSLDGVDYPYGIPDWEMGISEVLNDSPGVGSGYSLPEAHAWTNLSYFLARIERERPSESFYPLRGLWELRAALETVHKDDGENDVHVPGTATEKYNARVPAAAMWVFVLGKALYEFEKDLTPTSPNEGSLGQGGELWDGKPEFGKRRWGLWKRRFEEISHMRELSDEARNIVKEVVEVMNNVEAP